MKRDYFIYCTTPIDYWGDIPKASVEDAELVVRAMADIKAAGLGWEGDFSYGPFIFYVPGEIYMLRGVIWKQSNNGDTFVWSPIPLPHLNGISCFRARVTGEEVEEVK